MQSFEFNWETINQIKIYARGWESANTTKGVICLIHGFGEHCSRYAHVAKFYTNQGFSVLTYDHIGHGNSGGARGHTPSYEVYLNGISRLLEEAKKRYPNQKVILYGHSMGGNIVLNYLLRRKPSVEAVIVSGPWVKLAFEPPKFLYYLGKIMRRIYPAFTQESDLNPEHVSRDPVVVKAYVNDPLIHAKISSEAGMSMMDAGDYLLENAGQTDIPLLVMHAGDDQMTSPTASKEFADKMTGDVTYKLWEGMYHEIHNEPNKQEVFEYTLAWLNSKLSN